jgi:hypothetical protein
VTLPPLARRLASGALLFALPLAARAGSLPVLRAREAVLDVRDGAQWMRGVWAADPAARPDVFDVRRGPLPRRVTFVSDTDSLSFEVGRGESHDFVVLLASGDSCFTRISAIAGSAERIRPGASGPDTIPMSIAHGKLHFRGRIGPSQALDLIFDTGADHCVLYPSGQRKGVRLALDGHILNVGTGGSTERGMSSGNTIELRGLRWTHVPVIDVERQADDADGIVGYTLFEDKVVTLDFARGEMIVRDSLPADCAGFRRAPMSMSGSLTAVEVGFGGPGLRASGRFVLDTAGNGALLVSPAFAVAHDLGRLLKRLGGSTSGGVGPGRVQNDIRLLPELVLAGFTLRDVPIHVQQAAPGATSQSGGALCMEVLQRFDVILDYAGSEAWFRPNARFRDPIRARIPGSRWPSWAGVMIVVIVAIAAGSRRRRRIA